ncbi:MAG: DNA-3-methyladenine glycosylase I [Bacteroidetes bacterium]|nr:DNA-3-methyladenine glycosylase I [Bacteroidota bacterium]
MAESSPFRCKWCEKDDLYRKYHDEEWGNPSYDDQHLFEHLILETFQAGLSWYTILSKRENFREAFDGFDAAKICTYGEPEIQRLMDNPGIIRNRLKILAAINNAGRFLETQKKEGSFSNYMWSFTNHKTINRSVGDDFGFQATSPESDHMSKDMKKRGFKFVGSTTCYAFMQAIGMIDDHHNDCWKKSK